MDDLLSRPRAIRALAELRRIHPTPMTARMFMEATGYFSEPAQQLRKDLLGWRLITVTETNRGRVTIVEIRLTPVGVEVGDLALKLEEAAKKGRDAPEQA